VTEQLLPLGVFAVLIVVLATVFRLVPGASRRRLRRSVLLFGLYVVVLLATLLVARSGFTEVARGFGIARDLLAVLLVINMAALAIFDLLLPLIRGGYPDILHDLTVGAAYLVAIGWLMHRAGVNLTSIVATSAVVTAVIGLSLQSMLGNIVSGLALQVDESLKEGDWVELESKQQGQVKQIRWRHTVIETRDFDTLIVPNGQLMAQTIKVLGKRDGRSVFHRMSVHFCVDFRFSPSQIVQVVDEALTASPITNVALDPLAHCVCLDLARDNRDGYALYAARYWISDLARDDPTSSDVRERIYSALGRAHVPLAIPAATLFVSNDDPEHTERKQVREIESKLQALENVEIFKYLDDAERRSLATAARRTPFGPGEVITRQGTSAHWLYVLTKGRAEVRLTSNGADKRVAVLTAPSFFGEMALMTGQPREATVVALTEVECLSVDKLDFQGILKRRPEIAEHISQILAVRRIELDAAREGLDPSAKSQRLSGENVRILRGIKTFFGL